MSATRECPPDEIICLVDDDVAVVKSISRLLASDGLAVRAFTKPKEFSAHVKMHAISLVILDIWMEEMNGLEVQAHLSTISPNARVIIMSGWQDAQVRLTSLHLGAIAFFSKPFRDTQFLSAVRGALAMKLME
jgi:FixJ family two-component response regulator